jgi:transposase
MYTTKRASEMELGTYGIDLLKAVFQLRGVDLHGRPCLRKQLRRAATLSFFVKRRPSLIGMEACGGTMRIEVIARRLGA